jgi:hypothetical protein
MFDEDYEREQEDKARQAIINYVTRDSGKKTVHSDGVQRDTRDGKTKFTLMFPRGVPMREQLFTRVAELYTRGGEKYGDRNWENSCAPDTLDHHLEALWRHFMSFFFEENQEEDHAAAIIWNINAVEQTKRNLALKRAEEAGNEYADEPVVVNPKLRKLPEFADNTPKFGTPEFDAKAAEVAAKQAKDWPKQEGEPPEIDLFALDINETSLREERGNKVILDDLRDLEAQPTMDYDHKAAETYMRDEPALPEGSFNPSDDEVELAKSILARRQQFHDREARELLACTDYLDDRLN